MSHKTFKIRMLLLPPPCGAIPSSAAFDRYLFSNSKEVGTSVRDVVTGERVLRDGSFCPAAYHAVAGRFVTVTPGGGFRLTRLVGG
jgi:hypothetical protein